jgi:hypothetical protein
LAPDLLSAIWTRINDKTLHAYLSVAPLLSSVTVLMTPPDEASRAIASANASTTKDSASSRVMSALWKQ